MRQGTSVRGRSAGQHRLAFLQEIPRLGVRFAEHAVVLGACVWPLPCARLTAKYLIFSLLLFFHWLRSACVTAVVVCHPPRTALVPFTKEQELGVWDVPERQLRRERTSAGEFALRRSRQQFPISCLSCPKLLSCLPAARGCLCLQQWVTAVLGRAGDISWISCVGCQPKQMREEEGEKNLESSVYSASSILHGADVCVCLVLCSRPQQVQSPSQALLWAWSQRELALAFCYVPGFYGD